MKRYCPGTRRPRGGNLRLAEDGYPEVDYSTDYGSGSVKHFVDGTPQAVENQTSGDRMRPAWTIFVADGRLAAPEGDFLCSSPPNLRIE